MRSIRTNRRIQLVLSRDNYHRVRKSKKNKSLDTLYFFKQVGHGYGICESIPKRRPWSQIVRLHVNLEAEYHTEIYVDL